MAVWANCWRLGRKLAHKFHLPRARPEQGGSIWDLSPNSPQAVSSWELCSSVGAGAGLGGTPSHTAASVQSGSGEDVSAEVRQVVPKQLGESKWGYNLFKNTEHKKYCGTWSSSEKRFGKKAEGVSMLQTQPDRAETPAAICVDC